MCAVSGQEIYRGPISRQVARCRNKPNDTLELVCQLEFVIVTFYGLPRRFSVTLVQRYCLRDQLNNTKEDWSGATQGP